MRAIGLSSAAEVCVGRAHACVLRQDVRGTSTTTSKGTTTARESATTATTTSKSCPSALRGLVFLVFISEQTFSNPVNPVCYRFLPSSDECESLKVSIGIRNPASSSAGANVKLCKMCQTIPRNPPHDFCSRHCGIKYLQQGPPVAPSRGVGTGAGLAGPTHPQLEEKALQTTQGQLGK
jgi:hypothetical protein